MSAENITVQLISAEELLAMGDIGRCELVDGRIVRMSPTSAEHGRIVSTLTRELGAFARRTDLGRVLAGEVGIRIRRNPDRVRGADIAFLSRRRWHGALPAAFLEVAPELVVEIVSRTDAWSAMREKIDDYFSIGVERLWVVEAEGHTVWIYRSPTESTRLGSGDTLKAEGILSGFELPVEDIFEE